MCRRIPIKSLNKALDLLELIGEGNGIGIRELAAKTGFPPPTVHRIVNTLVARGYLRQNQETKTYLLSTQFLYYSFRVQQQFDLIPIARPYLEKLSAETEASAVLCIHDKNLVVYIDHVHSQKHILRTFTRLGVKEPLYATAVGKIFLSQMPPAEREAYFGQIKMTHFTDNTITDRETILAQIASIREQGYALDEQERSIGVRCIAAPVRNHNGLVVAGISISGPVQLLPAKRVKSLSRQVINTAEQISAELGYR